MKSRYFTDEGWLQFRQIAKRRGKPEIADIAAALSFDPRTIQRWHSGEGVKEMNLALLQEKFGLSWNQIQDFTSEAPGHRSPRSRDPALTSPSSALRDLRQDRKNIIFKPEIRNRLLQTDDPPSLLECVCASRTQLPASPQEKNTPIIANTETNLFFQLSAIIQAALPRSKKIVTLGAPRKKIPGTQKYEHTNGFSVLFGASFPFNITPSDPIDRWVSAIEVSPSDAFSLISGPNPLLFAILRYKIDLVGFEAEIKPFAVIVRNEALEGRPRAYCQYCFQVTIDWSTVSSKEDVNINSQIEHEISSAELDITVLRESWKPENLFRSDNGKLSLMDLLAYRKLKGESGVLHAGDPASAKLIPGFNLVPKAHVG